MHIYIYPNPLPVLRFLTLHSQEFKRAKAEKRLREEQELRMKALEEAEEERRDQFERVRSMVSSNRQEDHMKRQKAQKEAEETSLRLVCIYMNVCM